MVKNQEIILKSDYCIHLHPSNKTEKVISHLGILEITYTFCPIILYFGSMNDPEIVRVNFREKKLGNYQTRILVISEISTINMMRTALLGDTMDIKVIVEYNSFSTINY